MGDKCPSTARAYVSGAPVVGSLSFKSLALIIGWVCFGITAVLWLGLVIPHLRRYNSPHEQRQIFRIVTTPLLYSLFGLISIYAYRKAPYLEHVPELYEAYALASLFMLYVHYTAPDTHSREEFFKTVKRLSNGEEKPGGSFRFFRVRLKSVV
jgi:tellurite resistance protein TehA-like permease